MDFMKVFDQTVREIQREVNLRVLKVPEIEQKVLDATCNEPWGPHGSALSEIAQATKKFADCQMIMNVLWARLTDTGRNWRHVYKALAVIEYLVANGSERAVDDIIEHTFQISSLSGFEYVEPNGKDMGINVRKKAETILATLNSKEKIDEMRKKASANREKYVGVSSSGMRYKSSSSSYGGSSYEQSGHYGGFGNSREDSHTADRDISGDDIDWNRVERPGARRGHADESGDTRYKNESSNEAARPKGSSKVTQSSESSTALPTDDEDDFDDFDPRGTSSSDKRSAAAATNQGDLFGGSLIDLMDDPAPAPAPAPTETNYAKTHASEDVDLFADANFVSATPLGDAKVDSVTQPSVNLFEQQSASPATFSTPVDPFKAFTPSVPAEAPSSKLQSTASDSFDPFGAVPLNKFDGSDIFGNFTSSNAPAQSSVTGEAKSSDQKSTAESRSQTRKDAFQVKSGIWADSISRGLIDLNISAPKKVSLADVGVVGGLRDNSATASAYMGQSMGIGLGPSVTTHAGIFAPPAASNSSLSSFGQQQFGSFK